MTPNATPIGQTLIHLGLISKDQLHIARLVRAQPGQRRHDNTVVQGDVPDLHRGEQLVCTHGGVLFVGQALKTTHQ